VEEGVVSLKDQNLSVSLYPSLSSQKDLHGGGASAGASLFPPFDDCSFDATAAYVGLPDMFVICME
jgi:hypothetical protein